MKLGKRKIFAISFFVLVFVLGYVSPALADYLGPNRTVTVTTTSCEVILWSCQWVEAKNIWKYNKSDSWSCAKESKPWQQYPSAERTCDADNNGYDYWDRSYTDSTSIVTYPPATAQGLLQGCVLYNGWCNTDPTLSLSAEEPVAGYSIAKIEGTLNGQAFYCPAGTSCSRSLLQGNNFFTYWAQSTFGDTSDLWKLTAKVDTVAPTVSNAITGVEGANGWYISNVTISASGADATSGLASAQVSVNGRAWQTSEILTDGTYSVYSRTIDNAGNAAVVIKNIYVDTLAPSVTPVIPLAGGPNGWIIKGPAVVSAEGADAGSGLASVQVSVDNAAWQSSLTLADGIHTVQFRSIDVAGNSTTVTRTVKVDTTAPVVSVSTVGTSGNGGWYTSKATTTITPSDTVSGIDRVEYSDNGGSWLTGTSIPSTDGVHSLDVRVYDLVGNVTTRTITVKVDTVMPTVNAIFPSPDGRNGWVVSVPSAVSAEGLDTGSGLASAQVSLDHGPWQTALSLPDGIHTVTFKTTDHAGNSSSTTQTIKVDTIPPSLAITSDGIAGKAGWYVNQVTIEILAADDTSGIDQVQYDQNGGGWESGSSFTSGDGVNTIAVRASDAAGNVSADTLQVKVDTVAPSISSSTLGIQGTSGWYLSKTITTLLPEDETSGVDRVEYSQDGAAWQNGTSIESQDGVNSISVKAYDHAGNVSADTLQVKVDTGKPSSTFILPVNGTMDNLARGIFTISGSSTDALSGVSIAELSFDQGMTWVPLELVNGKWTYQLNTPTLEDGVYKLILRTTDFAGNVDTPETSPAYVRLIINNVAPEIKLTPEWFIWQSGSLLIHPGYFPLKSGMITISDPQKRWPMVEIPFGEDYPKLITWDRRFANGFPAPSGTYIVTVRACNSYDLCSHKTAAIKIPWLAVVVPTLQTAPIFPHPGNPIVEGVKEQTPLRPIDPAVSPPASQRMHHNTVGRIPTAPVQVPLGLVTLITLLWTTASASLSDGRPVAINALTKTFSQEQDEKLRITKE